MKMQVKNLMLVLFPLMLIVSCGSSAVVTPVDSDAGDGQTDAVVADAAVTPDAVVVFDSSVPDSNLPDVSVPDSNVPDSTQPDASVPDAEAGVPDAGTVPNPNMVCYHPACPWWASIDITSPEKTFLLKCAGFTSNVANTVIHLDASTHHGGTGTVTLNGVTQTYNFNVTDGSRHDGATFIYNVYYDDSLTQNEANSMETSTLFEVVSWTHSNVVDWAVIFSSGGKANSQTEGLYLCENQ